MLRSLLSRIHEFGVTPKLPASSVKYVRFSNAAALASALFATAFFVLELPLIIEEDVPSSRQMLLISIRLGESILFLLPLLLNAKGYYRTARIFLIVLAVFLLVNQSVLYAQNAPSHLFFFPMVAAVVALFPKKDFRQVVVLVGICALGFVTSLVLRHRAQPIVSVQSTTIIRVMNIATSLGAFALAVVIARALRAATDQAEQQVIEEQEKADRLLLNILPGQIAERLKENPDVIADGFTEATVLFADLVGFTPLTEKMTPREVVALMDRVFSRFDDLSDRFGLEKIKTIGDAYMLAGGLPEPTSDHAEAVADMALAMLPAVSEIITPTGHPLQVRIGVSTGPLVAGVIGRKKFIYDLWGDTVNTASRMESQGIEGRIQVTETTWSRLRDSYHLTERGIVEIKGKGPMRTWFLDGPRARSQTRRP